ncbi:hypothetical protein WICPIJ_009149, partial [Wickerhamomyces pijperi]
KDVDVVEAEKDQGTVFGVHLVEEVDSFVDVDNFEDLASDSNVGILTVVTMGCPQPTSSAGKECSVAEAS